jgi:hypothetical protein
LFDFAKGPSAHPSKQRVANKQSHCNPFQPFLGVGWVIG